MWGSQSQQLQRQWEELNAKVGEMDWNSFAEWDMKAGITLHTFDTTKFWYW